MRFLVKRLNQIIAERVLRVDHADRSAKMAAGVGDPELLDFAESEGGFVSGDPCGGLCRHRSVGVRCAGL